MTPPPRDPLQDPHIGDTFKAPDGTTYTITAHHGGAIGYVHHWRTGKRPCTAPLAGWRNMARENRLEFMERT